MIEEMIFWKCLLRVMFVNFEALLSPPHAALPAGLNLD